MPASNASRSNEPQSQVDVAALTAIEGAKLSLEDDGRKLDRMVVFLYSEGDDPNATVAFHIEDATDGDDPLDQILRSGIEAYYATSGRSVQFIEQSSN